MVCPAVTKWAIEPKRADNAANERGDESEVARDNLADPWMLAAGYPNPPHKLKKVRASLGN